ncbi:MAG: hypothetical protein IJT91_05550 [Clostridia bacterium]|nr:hypothetical protein [Clostridia bacterium]
MESIFIKILNMSITAAWVTLAVMLLRLIFRKAPKRFIAALWILVAVRLVCPFGIESALSLIPSAETVPQDIMHAEQPEIHTGIPFINSYINPAVNDGIETEPEEDTISGDYSLPESLAPTPENSADPMQVVTYIASVVWIAGMGVMLLYAVVCALRVHMKVRESIPAGGSGKGVYMCDGIGTPFIFGLLRPNIYLPSGISEKDAGYVIAHEKAHLKRRDHLLKPFAFLLLTVNWFNPVLWIAYILFCRDIEFACDEKVIAECGGDTKKEYSTALVNCSIPRRTVSACPICFGENGVKSRIRRVLDYKKPTLWIIVIAAVAAAAAAVCLLTNPISTKAKEEPADEITGRYVYTNENTFDYASLAINEKDHTFSYGWSVFSSYIGIGKYEKDGDKYFLKTDDGQYYHTFIKTDGGFVFVADESSPMPEYKYSSNSQPEVCVPDGAVFRLNDDVPIGPPVETDGDITDDSLAEFLQGDEKEKYSGMILDSATCFDITPDGITEETGVKIYRDTDRDFTLLVTPDGDVISIKADNEFGIISAVTCDFDNDGNRDILFTSSLDALNHKSTVVLFNTQTKEFSVIYGDYNNYLTVRRSPTADENGNETFSVYGVSGIRKSSVDPSDYIVGKTVAEVGTVSSENGKPVFRHVYDYTKPIIAYYTVLDTFEFKEGDTVRIDDLLPYFRSVMMPAVNNSPYGIRNEYNEYFTEFIKDDEDNGMFPVIVVPTDVVVKALEERFSVKIDATDSAFFDTEKDGYMRLSAGVMPDTKYIDFIGESNDNGNFTVAFYTDGYAEKKDDEADFRCKMLMKISFDEHGGFRFISASVKQRDDFVYPVGEEWK